jgi:hypothetical protein
MGADTLVGVSYDGHGWEYKPLSLFCMLHMKPLDGAKHAENGREEKALALGSQTESLRKSTKEERSNLYSCYLVLDLKPMD